MSTSNQGPAIRSFQFDSDGIGAVKNSVNLFRGKVELPLTLISLEGRDGFDASVQILYSGDVNAVVDVWNLDAPTGILGLGWSLPIERIVVDTKSSASQVYDDYYYSAGGYSYPLVPSIVPWLRLVLDQSLTADLNTGGTVSPALCQAFANGGLALADTATVAVVTSGSAWTIADPVGQATYNASLAGSSINVLDGGQAFEVKNYEFWKIRYYPAYERWAITRDNGITSVYGGGVTGSNGAYGSAGNSVEWGVKWNDWLGSSGLVSSSAGTTEQQQYATAWNLAQTEDVWGNTIAYTYTQTTQPVGTGGTPYTKAVYLDTISDTFGRTLTFVYGQKNYDSTTPAGIREYMDPHKAAPDNTPNAYQDHYETNFLDHILVNSEEGAPLYTVQFAYNLQNVTGYATSDPVFGDTYKRYLTGITLQTPGSDPQPGLQFGYLWTNDTTQYRGALQTITYPEGATATYTYESATIDAVSRDTQIANPFTSTEASPRIWFGPDYAVSVWYMPNGTSGKLSITVYSWLAGWYGWQPTVISATQPIDLDTLTVNAEGNFFALTFLSQSSEQYQTYLFHKDPLATGQWIEYQPPTNAFGTLPPNLATGDQFFLIGYRDGSNKFHLNRYSWSRPQRTWLETSVDNTLCSAGVASSNQQFYVTAYRNYYAALCYDGSGGGNNRIQIFYQDTLGNWYAGPSATPSFVIASTGSNSKYIEFAPSDTFLTLTVVTNWNYNQPNYTNYIFQWDENYSLPNLITTQQVSHLAAVAPLGPQTAADSLIQSGTNLARYGGSFQDTSTNGWLEQSLPFSYLSATPPQSVYHWAATGPNYALKSDSASVGVKAVLAAFDPNTDFTTWTTAQQTLYTGTPAQNRTRRYFVTAGGEDYFTYDQGLYYRGTSTNWADANEQHLLATLGSGLKSSQYIDTTTIQNQAPFFLAYQVIENSNPAGSSAIFLRNGQLITDSDGSPVVWNSSENLYAFFNASTGTINSQSNGKMPSGPSSFYTYPATNLDGTSHLTLYRYVADALTGSLTDFRVTSLTIDDGYTSYGTAFTYDNTTAAFDPSGTVAKYFKVCSYPGCTDPSQATNGYTESCYLNGLPTANQGTAQVYSMLDGLLATQTVYDAAGAMLNQQQSTYQVFSSVSTELGVFDLWGGWVRVVTSQTMRDGVTQSATMTYDQTTGAVASTSTANCDGLGNTVALETASLFAATIYSWLQRHNVLQPTAQQTQTFGGSVSKVNASTYQAWTRTLGGGAPALTIFAPAASYVWMGGSASSTFDFATWQSGQTIDGWQCQSTIMAMTNFGQTAEVVGVDGLTTSRIYDQDGEQVVAVATNASVSGQEAGYCGFEAYESSQGWQAGGGAAVVSGIAHSGQSSLELPEAGTLTASFTPAIQGQSYWFGFYYRTGTGFTPASGSGWTISFRQAGQPVGTPLQLPFAATDGDWLYLGQPIVLPTAGGGPVTIELAAANAAATAVYLDDLAFAPFLGQISAQVYDPLYRVPVAMIGPVNQSSALVYDPLRRQIASVDGRGRVQSIASPYLSRGGTANENAFNPNDPNSNLTVQATDGGRHQDYAREPDWQQFWSSGTGHWQVSNGALVHTATESDTLTLITPTVTGDFAIRVLVTPEGTLSAPLGLTVGTLTIQWTPATQSWTLATPTATLMTSATGTMGADWFLVVSGSTLIFQANGQRIFSYVAGGAITGTPALFTGNQIALSDVLVAVAPRVAVALSDGASNQRQSQALGDTTCLVGAQLYDSQGRGAVRTKTGGFALQPGSPFLAYRPSFVTDFDWGSGAITGDVVECYPGDGGYPYSRTMYEAAPGGRPVEQGQPGADFAIVNPAGTSPSSRNTVKTVYGTNQEGGFPPSAKLNLPGGQYYLVTTTDQNGLVSYRLSDQTGFQVASGVQAAISGETCVMSSRYRSVNAQGMRTIVTRQPNYYQGNGGNTGYQISEVQNPIGQVLSSTAPDTGLTQFIFDSAGRVRFSQNANGAAGTAVGQPYILYIKYDQLGRIVEKGIVPWTWGDGSTLQAQADNATFPSSGNIPARQFTFDGDGTDPNLVGRLWTATVCDASGKPALTETYSYDVNGKIIGKSQSVVGFNAGGADAVSYGFDSAGRITSIGYPTGSDGGTGTTPFTVLHDYNMLGQLATISVNNGGTVQVIGQYTYNPDGSLATESFNPDQTNAISRSLTYNPPGWLTNISDGFFTESLSYTTGGAGGAGWYNGIIAASSVTFPTLTGATDNFVPAFAYSNGYDPLYRLVTAQCSVQGQAADAWSISSPTGYDDNGNLLDYSGADQTQTYAYNAGTNQVANTTGSDGQSDYVYNPNGNIVTAASLNLSLAYEPLTGLTQSVTRAQEAAVDFTYGSINQRVVKQSGSISTLYISGASARPLVQRQPGGAISFNIYGPTGLLAVFTGGQQYTVLVDHEGSVRVVVDPSGTAIAAYNYLPFGATLGTDYQSVAGAASIIAYRYTGQELDAETGLYNFDVRLYDPVLKRFYGPDPAGQSTSPYVYGFDDPLVFDDPSGMISFSSIAMWTGTAVLTALGIAGAIAAEVATAGGATPAIVALYSLGGSIAFGAGVNSAAYMVENGSDASVGGWAGQAGIGALQGLIGGGIGIGASAAAEAAAGRMIGQSALRIGIAKVGIEAAGGAVAGTLEAGVAGGLNGDFSWNAVLAGGVSGGVAGALSSSVVHATESWIKGPVSTIPFRNRLAFGGVNFAAGVGAAAIGTAIDGALQGQSADGTTWGLAALELPIIFAQSFAPTTTRRLAQGIANGQTSAPGAASNSNAQMTNFTGNNQNAAVP